MQNSGLVDFAQIAPFEWDRVYVFGPYSTEARIHKELGFEWPDVKRTSIAHDDTIHLVVFTLNRDVVHWFEHGRKEDLSYIAGKGYDRENAKFGVYTVEGARSLGQ